MVKRHTIPPKMMAYWIRCRFLRIHKNRNRYNFLRTSVLKLIKSVMEINPLRCTSCLCTYTDRFLELDRDDDNNDNSLHHISIHTNTHKNTAQTHHTSFEHLSISSTSRLHSKGHEARPTGKEPKSRHASTQGKSELCVQRDPTGRVLVVTVFENRKGADKRGVRQKKQKHRRRDEKKRRRMRREIDMIRETDMGRNIDLRERETEGVGERRRARERQPETRPCVPSKRSRV